MRWKMNLALQNEVIKDRLYLKKMDTHYNAYISTIPATRNHSISIARAKLCKRY